VTAIAACRTCGTEALENTQFCHGCGSPISEPDTHAEYTQVRVLFADVVHSMDIAAAVGAEWLRLCRHISTPRLRDSPRWPRQGPGHNGPHGQKEGADNAAS
jgi:hypothetical protein